MIFSYTICILDEFGMIIWVINSSSTFLMFHGFSASREWGSAVVVGVVRSSAVSILAVAGGMGHLYVCHAPNTVFTTLVHVLAKYQLSMVRH